MWPEEACALVVYWGDKLIELYEQRAQAFRESNEHWLDEVNGQIHRTAERRREIQRRTRLRCRS
jgi:hypothetical protein